MIGSLNNDSFDENKFVLLSIGSNIGNRGENINRAIVLLQEANAIDSVKISSFYETEPVGIKEQPWYINAAISGYTKLPLNNFLQICKSIEYSLGRIKRLRWLQRELDIDILLYGDELMESENLTIPHKRMHERRFVLIPAAEIAGSVVHTKFGKTIEQLLNDCSDNAEVKLFHLQ